jgi:hypothetical protein
MQSTMQSTMQQLCNQSRYAIKFVQYQPPIGVQHERTQQQMDTYEWKHLDKKQQQYINI